LEKNQYPKKIQNVEKKGNKLHLSFAFGRENTLAKGLKSRSHSE
jgi:hypothetical protein